MIVELILGRGDERRYYNMFSFAFPGSTDIVLVLSGGFKFEPGLVQENTTERSASILWKIEIENGRATVAV
jgi:hypothetical protein